MTGELKMALSDKELQNLAEDTAVLGYTILKEGKRNMFAAVALQGMLAVAGPQDLDKLAVCKAAFRYADLMIAESEK